jgi:hypothetical protein
MDNRTGRAGAGRSRLTNVPASRARSLLPETRVIVLVAAVGLVGYALGHATAPPITPTPNPLGVAVLASPTSVVATTPVVPRPSPSAASPSAPAAPLGAFERTVFTLDEELSVEQLWGVGDQVLGLARRWDSSYIALLHGADRWSLAAAPPAIDSFAGGVAVDGRLWFLVRVTGLRATEITVRLAGGTGHENAAWKSLGKSTLDPDIVPRWLDHIRDTWVTGYIGEGGNIEIGAPQHLVWSRDGVQWSKANVPSLRGVDPFDVALNSVGSTRDVMVVSAMVDRAEGGGSVLLVSRNGVDWREVPAPVDPGWASTLTCNDARCVLTRWNWEGEAPMIYPTPIAWVSGDGLTWTPAQTVLADEAAGSGLAYVAAAGDGFVGIDRETNRLWVSSPDGLTWRGYDVLPAELKVPIIDVAAARHRVVALEQGPDVEPQGAWVGSLAGLAN